MCTLFISDLHLSSAKPKLGQLFVDFLRWANRPDLHLYILGDLFDAWIGDDAPDPALLPIILELKNLIVNGCQIHVMHGNRDFLIGDHFCQQTGCQLIGDPCIIELNGKAVLLCHGDTLCIDDVPYQQFRSQVRDPMFIQDFLSKTVAERLSFAKQLRAKSQKEISEKDEIIMDVNQAAVVQTMEKHGVKRLIHGHTHRLAIHEHRLEQGCAQRFVLGDWHDNEGNFLQIKDGHFQLLSYPTLAPINF